MKGDKSPYDGELVYWSKRKSELYNGRTAKALKNQRHICGYCGLTFVDEAKGNKALIKSGAGCG